MCPCPQVKRLSDAGMVFVGATPFDEFGIGARDMFAVPDAVLSPWRSKDKAGGEAPFFGRQGHSSPSALLE
jgi:Asp-tRNA(Asn)/Glu-tRNA(Gln) amidotransferase A subunit family amidase